MCRQRKAVCVCLNVSQREEGFVGVYVDTNNVDKARPASENHPSCPPETERIPAFVLARLVGNMAEPLTQRFSFWRLYVGTLDCGTLKGQERAEANFLLWMSRPFILINTRHTGHTGSDLCRYIIASV